MNFGGFLGSDTLKERLAASFRQGKSSHCYLLCGPAGSGRHTLALQMAAALECRDEQNPGCGVCPACRKVLARQHPDVITVDDTEHKNVAVDVVRQARSDVFIRPNEGRAGTSCGKDQINLKLLQNRGIDYLALGHLHTHSLQKLDETGAFCYSGCLEGRGFDECGEKGFVLLIRTKRFGGTCIKNRRINSSPDMVISFQSLWFL